MIAGSNPNADVTTVKYPTEYRAFSLFVISACLLKSQLSGVEYLSPPYLTKTRPTLSAISTKISYGSTFTIRFTLPANTNVTSVALMDLGFATHGVHMDQRLVFLNAVVASNKRSARVTAPPNGGVYPPGNGYLFVVADGGTLLSSRLSSASWLIIRRCSSQPRPKGHGRHRREPTG
jgi:hypothetical protein